MTTSATAPTATRPAGDAPAPHRAVRDVIYADFTCPACYLASLRVDRLLAAKLPAPDWRAVEHRPRLPFSGLRLDAAARDLRDRELAATRRLLRPGEELPTSAPGALPHTASAVAAYAEAYEAGVADLVRPLLFRAYWIDGMDIGDPEVLRRLLPGAFRQGRHTSDAIHQFGYAVTSQHAPLTYAAGRRMREWERDWLALGSRVELTLVADGAALTGEQALGHLPDPATEPAAGPVQPAVLPRQSAAPAGSPVESLAGRR